MYQLQEMTVLLWNGNTYMSVRYEVSLLFVDKDTHHKSICDNSETKEKVDSKYLLEGNLGIWVCYWTLYKTCVQIFNLKADICQIYQQTYHQTSMCTHSHAAPLRRPILKPKHAPLPNTPKHSVSRQSHSLSLSHIYTHIRTHIH